MRIAPPDAPSAQAVSLAGAWRYKVGAAPKDLRMPTAPRPAGPPRSAGSMFNGMIAPLIPYGVAGVIWYQGESNAGRPIQYRSLFPALIRSWRDAWGQDDLPFLFVQLANFLAPPAEPDEGGWAWLREAQTMALSLPATAMAVTIDIGQADNIHPTNKQDVGKRLGMAALGEVYGHRLIVPSGPLYESMEVEGDKIRLHFRHVGGGLVIRDGPLKHIAVAGADRKFVWAQARVEPSKMAGRATDTLVVWSPQVAKPVAVRYAWASNPAGCNLYNKAHLPASPFRTDDWPRPAPQANR
jgi:sialate O-acetylesterase